MINGVFVMQTDVYGTYETMMYANPAPTTGVQPPMISGSGSAGGGGGGYATIGPKAQPKSVQRSYFGFLACEIAFDVYASSPQLSALSVGNGAAILSIQKIIAPELGAIGLLYAGVVEIPTSAAANASCSVANGY